MPHEHPESEAIGRVTHYYSHLLVAAVSLDAPLRVGEDLEEGDLFVRKWANLRSANYDHTDWNALPQ